MKSFFDAFISYGRTDSKAFATKLHNRLTEQGLQVWFDQNDIPLGVDFQNQINNGIQKAHNFIFIITPYSLKSPYCLKEILQAVKYNKRIIPLLYIEPQTQELWDKMHPTIRKINWIDFQEAKDNFEESFAGLMNLVAQNTDYVEQHTKFLVKALEWERNQKQTKLGIKIKSMAWYSAPTAKRSQLAVLTISSSYGQSTVRKSAPCRMARRSTDSGLVLTVR
jgi:hypothetical protein